MFVECFLEGFKGHGDGLTYLNQSLRSHFTMPMHVRVEASITHHLRDFALDPKKYKVMRFSQYMKIEIRGITKRIGNFIP